MNEMEIERRSVRCTTSFEDGLKEFKKLVSSISQTRKIISIAKLQ
jgi:hypothetical protein